MNPRKEAGLAFLIIPVIAGAAIAVGSGGLGIMAGFLTAVAVNRIDWVKALVGDKKEGDK